MAPSAISARVTRSSVPPGKTTRATSSAKALTQVKSRAPKPSAVSGGGNHNGTSSGAASTSARSGATSAIPLVQAKRGVAKASAPSSAASGAAGSSTGSSRARASNQPSTPRATPARAAATQARAAIRDLTFGATPARVAPTQARAANRITPSKATPARAAATQALAAMRGSSSRATPARAATTRGANRAEASSTARPVVASAPPASTQSSARAPQQSSVAKPKKTKAKAITPPVKSKKATKAATPAPVKVQKPKPICVICQDVLGIKRKVTIRPCGHQFHRTCCLKYLETREATNLQLCPICRGPAQVIKSANKLIKFVEAFGPIGQPTLAYVDRLRAETQAICRFRVLDFLCKKTLNEWRRMDYLTNVARRRKRAKDFVDDLYQEEQKLNRRVTIIQLITEKNIFPIERAM